MAIYENAIDMETRRNYQMYVVFTFLCAVFIYYLVTTIIPFFRCQYLSWKNRTIALTNTKLELEVSEKELATLNSEIAKQKQIIAERMHRIPKSREPHSESKFELPAPNGADNILSFAELKGTPIVPQRVERVAPQDRFSLSADQKSEDATLRWEGRKVQFCSDTPSLKHTTAAKKATRKPSEFYSRPPLPQPPLASLLPEHALEEQRREIIRQQDLAYAEAMAKDAAKMAAASEDAKIAHDAALDATDEEDWGEVPMEPNVSTIYIYFCQTK